jgi:hypothetical protein
MYQVLVPREIFDFLPWLQQGILSFRSRNNIIHRKFIYVLSGYCDENDASLLAQVDCCRGSWTLSHRTGAASEDDDKLEELLQAKVQHCVQIGAWIMRQSPVVHNPSTRQIRQALVAASSQ